MNEMNTRKKYYNLCLLWAETQSSPQYESNTETKSWSTEELPVMINLAVIKSQKIICFIYINYVWKSGDTIYTFI